MKKIFFISLAIVFAGWLLSSCVDLDTVPSEQWSDVQIGNDPTGLEYATMGAYSWFKDHRSGMSNTQSSGDRYIRHWFQMNEHRGDNIAQSSASSDPFYASYSYQDNDGVRSLRYFWYCSYSIINLINNTLKATPEGRSTTDDHLLGENYFLRALVYLNLCDLFAYPYANTKGGMNTPAVVIKLPDTPLDAEVTRATLGQVYDLVESDLRKAIELMGDIPRNDNATYARKSSAQGLLTRLYLYKEENQKVVDMVNEMLAGSTPNSKLDPNIEDYFTRPHNSVETLWCVGVLASENAGTSSIASMYYASPNGGWGEHYPSTPMCELFTRYANDDKRWYDFHLYPVMPQTGTTSIYTAHNPGGDPEFVPPVAMASWPASPIQGNFHRQSDFRYIAEDANGRYIVFSHDIITNPLATTPPATDTYFGDPPPPRIYIQEEIVNTYPKYFIEFKGQKQYIEITGPSTVRNSIRRIYSLKFSNQDGNGMLSSPVFIRWAEVLLNRAEAYAKQGKVAEALADVNVIRSRAGLSGDQLMTVDNMGSRGYTNILDVVLDERRIELCYEGFRWKDLYRNNMAMDRQFAGFQPWEIVQPTDLRIPFQIPADETQINKGVLPNLR